MHLFLLENGYFFRSIKVSGKLPTYPSPKPSFYPKRDVSVNVSLGEGVGGQFPRNLNRSFFPPVWPTVHTYPVKTVTENAPFQKRSPEASIFKNSHSRLRVDWRKK